MSLSQQQPSRSFEPNGALTVELATGQVAHRDHVAQSQRLERKFYTIRPGVWCLVGNGLSNQTFVDAPDGIIAIDTGESIEEMRAAIKELRAVTQRPIVAVLYTHFHYVGGTQAVFEEDPSATIPIWGHEKIAFNRLRTTSEIAPAYGRGLVEQFAVTLPFDGIDGVVNVGLGQFYRDPAHAPHTYGFIAPGKTFNSACTINVAGLSIDVTPAPSDADDSVTYWFDSIKLCVNNLVWPVLFNVFAIRGEEYRDPQVLLHGLDHLLRLHAQHLAGAHGPPISGDIEINDRITKYRDSIQFLWDQTVRHTNRGMSSADLAATIRLPDQCDDDYLTSELYGVAEHHVRQIRSGLFGFFDGEESNLFPLSTQDHADRMIKGFGGKGTVRTQAQLAIQSDDLRFAIELGSWLVHGADSDATDKQILANALRLVAQRTPAANIRNWCLTRARHLDGSLDASRFNTHRISKRQIMSGPISSAVQILRVLLDPTLAQGIDMHIAFEFLPDQKTGLHIRNCVAVATDGSGALHGVACDISVWADIMSGSKTLTQAISASSLQITGDKSKVLRALACFDVAGLQS
ncbi:MAG: MBL fold metallo-hydrolase [Acidimicrobiaceae bacterium]|nr:MBL fold metallo-hydrolase [Acidimicrobiaceae bacterium]